MRPHSYHVYILTNAHHTVLYTGVTNDLRRRMEEHRSGRGGAFTRRYNAHTLVYAEPFPSINDAIAREKQIKSWSRRRKVDLVETHNPDWQDRSNDLAASAS